MLTCRQQVSLLHTSLLVYQQKLFSYDKQSNTYAPIYKTFAIIGSIVSFIFLGLLLIPGSPASLPGPSYIALAIWLVIGLIFFFIRYPKLKKMDNDELSRLILNRSENEVEDMVDEPRNNLINTKMFL